MKGFAIFISFIWPVCCYEHQIKIPVGLIFDYNSTHLEEAVIRKIKQESEADSTFTLDPRSSLVDSSDSYNVSRALCALLSGGAVTIVGDFRPNVVQTVKDYARDTQIPVIYLNNPVNPRANQNLKDEDLAMQIHMTPSLTRPIVTMMTVYYWDNFHYVYDNPDGIHRLEQILEFLHEYPYFTPEVQPHLVYGNKSILNKVLGIYNDSKGSDIRAILDVKPELAQHLIDGLLATKECHKVRFHFILPFLSMREMYLDSYATGGINITGFEVFDEGKVIRSKLREQRIIKTYEHIAEDTAKLLMKSLHYIKDNQGSISLFNSVNGWHNSDDNSCVPILRKGWRYGRILAQGFQSHNITFGGQSGCVRFDMNGQRTDFNVSVLEITMYKGMSLIGTWQNDMLLAHGEEQVLDKSLRQFDNRTRTVTSINEKPYLMTSTYPVNGNPLVGRYRFYGYISELAEIVSRGVGYEYQIRYVLDGQYGRQQPDGTWNGVIGELIKHTADICIGPLTITSDREKVLDFTKPFMSLGISLMIKKPADTDPHVFSFMAPLSQEIWLCTAFAFIGVSVVLFLVSRFSYEEWQVDANAKLENDFTIGNSLWFSLGAFMQQGCDVLPKSISGRIVTSVWWFFTLIIISSYTANLAAFLTTMRMSGSIRSAEDLVKQTEIKYGPYRGGSTYMFFNQTTVSLYQRMWSFMTSKPSVFVEDNDEGIQRVRTSNGQYVYLIESTLNEYYNSRLPCDTMKAGANLDSKGYGIATPMGSDIKDMLTLSILQLREEGVLDELKKKWWVENSECPIDDNSKDTDAALTLTKVAGIFYILVTGLALSVVSVILEFLYKTKVDSRKQNVSFGSEARSKFRLSISGHSEDEANEQRTPLRATTTTFTYHCPPEERTHQRTQTLV